MLANQIVEIIFAFHLNGSLFDKMAVLHNFNGKVFLHIKVCLQDHYCICDKKKALCGPRERCTKSVKLPQVM